MTNRTPIEQATIFLSVGRYRRAAEILLQIIMDQEGRLREVEKRLSEREVNFTDGLEMDTSELKLREMGIIPCQDEEDDNFPTPLPGGGALRTSEMWYANLYPNKEVIILDPDGWDRNNYDWSWHQELISLDEFNKRLAISTVQISPDYCPHCKGPCQRNFCIYCGADFDECKCK